MKAILVIEMPTDCIKCPLADGYCWNTFPTKGKANGCPLKSMPMEFTVEKLSEEEQDSTKLVTNMATMKVFADGWNACLEEINK